MNRAIDDLITLLLDNDGIDNKNALAKIVCKSFSLTQDRSVYYCKDFAIRFSKARGQLFSNTVLSLSALQKYDDRPFVVINVTPEKNYMLIANSTFLTKISHSSQELRVDNIRGSFNGSDIVRNFDGIENTPENFGRLYRIHEAVSFDENLARLVESTNNIRPTGAKFNVSSKSDAIIRRGPERARDFVASDYFRVLKKGLDAKVDKFRDEILVASMIENVNIRGRVIEYLIAGRDTQLRNELIEALQMGKPSLPAFKTDNALGDYSRSFEGFETETDIKTKIMVLDSNPKAYNIDKMLEFLATEQSVFMFYFMGIDPSKIVNTILVSMFQEDLLSSTILLRHWAGRNSRGVTQFEGRTIRQLLLTPRDNIDIKSSTRFLAKLIEL